MFRLGHFSPRHFAPIHFGALVRQEEEVELRYYGGGRREPTIEEVLEQWELLALRRGDPIVLADVAHPETPVVAAPRGTKITSALSKQEEEDMVALGTAILLFDL